MKPKIIESKDFIEIAKALASPTIEKDGELVSDTSETYVVWYCKTLQNHKALLSAKPSGYPYIEITYNGDKGEFYIDEYTKSKHDVFYISEAGNIIDESLDDFNECTLDDEPECCTERGV